MRTTDHFPYPPRYLSRIEAARYVGVSVDVFDDEVRAGWWPPARPRGGRGGRLTWDRVLLDAAADQAAGLGCPNPGISAILADNGASAWEARISGAAERERAKRRPQAQA